MSRAIVKRFRARRDLIEAFAHLGADDPRAGDHFFASAESTFTRIAAMPDIGSLFTLRNPRLVGLRRAPVRGFKKYQVFYLAAEGSLDIIRVLHGSRDIRAILERED